MIIINNKNSSKKLTNVRPKQKTREYIRAQEAKRYEDTKQAREDISSKRRKRSISVTLPAYVIEGLTLHAKERDLTLDELLEQWYLDEIDPYRNVKNKNNDNSKRPVVTNPTQTIELQLSSLVTNGLSAYVQNHNTTLSALIEDYWFNLYLPDDWIDATKSIKITYSQPKVPTS